MNREEVKIITVLILSILFLITTLYVAFSLIEGHEEQLDKRFSERVKWCAENGEVLASDAAEHKLWCELENGTVMEPPELSLEGGDNAWPPLPS